MFKKLKEIFSDSIFYGLSTILGQLAGLVLVPFFTKELNPSDYGLLAGATITISVDPLAIFKEIFQKMEKEIMMNLRHLKKEGKFH